MLGATADMCCKDRHATAEREESSAALGRSHSAHAGPGERSLGKDSNDPAILQAFQSVPKGADVGAVAIDRNTFGCRPDPTNVLVEELLGDEEGKASRRAALDEAAIGTAGVIDDDESW